MTGSVGATDLLGASRRWRGSRYHDLAIAAGRSSSAGSLADLAGGEVAAGRVLGWVGRGPWPWRCFAWASWCRLGTRTANQELMIASFGNLTILIRIEFPKLAIMAPGGPTCWAGGAASPASGKSRLNQA